MGHIWSPEGDNKLYFSTYQEPHSFSTPHCSCNGPCLPIIYNWFLDSPRTPRVPQCYPWHFFPKCYVPHCYLWYFFSKHYQSSNSTSVRPYMEQHVRPMSSLVVPYFPWLPTKGRLDLVDARPQNTLPFLRNHHLRKNIPYHGSKHIAF